MIGRSTHHDVMMIFIMCCSWLLVPSVHSDKQLKHSYSSSRFRTSQVRETSIDFNIKLLATSDIDYADRPHPRRLRRSSSFAKTNQHQESRKLSSESNKSSKSTKSSKSHKSEEVRKDSKMGGSGSDAASNDGAPVPTSAPSNSRDDETLLADSSPVEDGPDEEVVDIEVTATESGDGDDEAKDDAPVAVTGAVSDTETQLPSSSPTTTPPAASEESDVPSSAPIRTVQLSHPSSSTECTAFDSTLSISAVRMINCTSTGTGSEEDHWEILSVTTELFLLRHKSSQLCIPRNPEHPNLSFDCFRYSGDSEAIADSINGLVDCDSGFAATMGLDNTGGSIYLYNTDCISEMEPGHETDVIFMSYSQNLGLNNTQIVMWGERILLGMTQLVQERNFQASWTLIDV